MEPFRHAPNGMASPTNNGNHGQAPATSNHLKRPSSQMQYYNTYQHQQAQHAQQQPQNNNAADGYVQYDNQHPSTKRRALFKDDAAHAAPDTPNMPADRSHKIPSFLNSEKAFEYLPLHLQQMVQLRLFRAQVGMDTFNRSESVIPTPEDESLENAYQDSLRNYLAQTELMLGDVDHYSTLQALMLLWKCNQDLQSALVDKNGLDGSSIVNDGLGSDSMTIASLSAEGKSIWTTYQTALGHYLQAFITAKQSARDNSPV